MVKRNNKKSELLLELLSTILIMIAGLILLDLYVPLKRLILGENLNFGEILPFLKLKQHIPVVMTVSIALVLYRFRKSNKVTDSSKSTKQH
jgi:hypothetical protein